MANYDEAYWRKLLTKHRPVALMGTLKRIVENQEQAVSLSLVDDLHEHQMLESMLEESKPSLPKELLRLDYLLRSPWRYPPLRWGSRFGRRHEPGIFYGSLSREALFAEAAYYRMVFVDGMEEPFTERVISQHTVFEAKFNTRDGIDLRDPPFSRRAKALRHKSDYSACQKLGTVLREEAYEALIFWSARAQTKVANVALLQPRSLRSRKHMNPRRGLCETHPDKVLFRFNREIYSFDRSQFLVDGRIPVPA